MVENLELVGPLFSWSFFSAVYQDLDKDQTTGGSSYSSCFSVGPSWDDASSNYIQ